MLLDYLRKEYERRKNQNSSYSIRAFAHSLKLDSSTVSKILKGRRKLTFSLAQKILDRLELNPAQKTIYLSALSTPDITCPTEDSFTTSPHDREGQELMKLWEFYAILSTLELAMAPQTPVALARALGSTPQIVRRIVEYLLKVGYLKMENRRLKITGVRLTAPPNYPFDVLAEVHKRYIDRGYEAMMNAKTRGLSDISGITFTMPSTKFVEAKNLIKEFRRSFARYLTRDDVKNDSVYRINLQFFPLFRGDKIRSEK
jgi:DNA-binding MarR family transcriptional regulator